jgi:hypothetical protein
MMEFHISKEARQRYSFKASLFSCTGNVIFANMPACRDFAQRMNQVRDSEKHPELAVHAGQLYAMGLIDEASHALMARYREDFDPEVMTSALEFFSAQVGPEALDTMLLTFVEHFPGASIIAGKETPRKWLEGSTDGTPHRAAALEELLLLWTANRNEAFQPFEELFQDKTLAEKTVYREVTQQLPDYFATRPLIPVADAAPVNLLDLLRAPAVGAPRSLSEQLDLIRRLWKPLLGESLDRFLLVAQGILHEEEVAIWMQFNPRRRASGCSAPPRSRNPAMALHRQPRRCTSIRHHRCRRGIREVLARHRMDAQHGTHRQKHLRLAGAAQQAVRPPHSPSQRHSGRGARHPRRPRPQLPLAHRRLGAQPRLQNHQAALRQL